MCKRLVPTNDHRKSHPVPRSNPPPPFNPSSMFDIYFYYFSESESESAAISWKRAFRISLPFNNGIYIMDYIFFFLISEMK